MYCDLDPCSSITSQEMFCTVGRGRLRIPALSKLRNKVKVQLSEGQKAFEPTFCYKVTLQKPKITELFQIESLRVQVII